MTAEGAVVGVDWGTTKCRAYLFAEGGAVVARCARDAGMKYLTRADYPGVLRELLAELGVAGEPRRVVVSGMAGARGGWHEAPYVPCPASAAAVAEGARQVPGAGNVFLVPGLVCRTDDVPDVLRGEETQILGLAAATEAPSFLAVAPGTHCKWLSVTDGVIRQFETYMTGEIYDVMTRHSIFSRFAAAVEPDEATFRAAVARIRNDRREGGAWRLLFSARSRVVGGDMPESQAFSWLSGLLIGAEIREAVGRPGFDRTLTTYVLGAPELTRLYRDALAQFGIEARPAPADVTAHGLWAVSRAIDARAVQ